MTKGKKNTKGKKWILLDPILMVKLQTVVCKDFHYSSGGVTTDESHIVIANKKQGGTKK